MLHALARDQAFATIGAPTPDLSSLSAGVPPAPAERFS
jgi:hypothetical protein